jgi:tetratricopeptide (TPR) repeat protein
MKHSRLAAIGAATALLLPVALFVAHAERADRVLPASMAIAQDHTPSLDQANAALQAGEADKALSLLAAVPTSGPQQALAVNLLCRVRFMLEQFEAAATACEKSVSLDPQNSDYHLWLGRALGEKAAHASFVTAFSLAKKTRAEFEQAVQLNPRNAEALTSLGEFYRQAPAIVGGGVDKAQNIANQLDKVDPARAHDLRGNIAEQQKDYAGAEREFRQAIASGTHPAQSWTSLAGFYGRRQRFPDMEVAMQTAMHKALSAALHDHDAGAALYTGAGLLTESKRDPALAATMLDDYLNGASKTEEAPAFIAHIRLARLKQQLGDPAAADRERAAALALAHDYKPAQDFRAQAATP